MIENIEDSFGDNLNSLSWMDETTRSAARNKLNLVTRRVGYPDAFRNYSEVIVDPARYFETTLLSRTVEFNRKANLIGGPVDRSAWEMQAFEVNAYYDPSSNSINFPAGFLLPPFFDHKQDIARNFGGIGLIMGHELTHGFDDQGRLYDGTGKLNDWWTPASGKLFDERAQCLAAQYSKFEVLPGLFVNGNLTLGENIADNGGMKMTTMSYLEQAKGAANLPLLWVSYAQTWCQVATDEYVRVRVATDVHSPPKFRVLGPLINLPQFSEQFKCPIGSRMNPAKRCPVW